MGTNFLSEAHAAADLCLSALSSEDINKSTYANAGVVGTSNFSSQLGPSSSMVLLTDGIKKPNKPRKAGSK